MISNLHFNGSLLREGRLSHCPPLTKMYRYTVQQTVAFVKWHNASQTPVHTEALIPLEPLEAKFEARRRGVLAEKHVRSTLSPNSLTLW